VVPTVFTRSQRELSAEFVHILICTERHRRTTMKASGDALIERGVRQQVTSDLLDGELMKWHVGIESTDDPVAKKPQRHVVVVLVARAVAIACEVEPVPRPFSPKRGEASSEPTRLSIADWRLRNAERMKVSTASGDGGRPMRSRCRRRQSVSSEAGVVGCKPSAFKRSPMKWSMALAFSGTAAFTGATYAQCVLYSAPAAIQARSVSVCFSVSAVLPPLARWHHFIVFACNHAPQQLALVWHARHDGDGIRLRGLHCRFALIEPQPAPLLVRSVALEAMLRENGAHLTREIRRGGAQRQRQSDEDAGAADERTEAHG